MDGKRDIKMSIIRNDAGEVRLAWRLILVIVLFVAVAVLLRFIPMRLLTASLVRYGMAQGDAVETANTIIGEDAVWSTAIGALSGLMGLLIVWFLIRALERSEFTWRAVGLIPKFSRWPMRRWVICAMLKADIEGCHR